MSTIYITQFRQTTEQHASGNARIFLIPSAETVPPNQELTYTITLKSTDPIRGIQVNISYPLQKLEYVGTESKNSAFEEELEQYANFGLIKIARETKTPKVGESYVATLTFITKEAVSARDIIQAPGSTATRSTDNKDVLDSFVIERNLEYTEGKKSQNQISLWEKITSVPGNFIQSFIKIIIP